MKCRHVSTTEPRLLTGRHLRDCAAERMRLSDLPISAPLWVWLSYFAMVLAFCVLSADIWPILVAAFSFQFWAFAIHRGLRRKGLI